MTKRNLISFDWALKKLLRNKANFGILEGFLSELLHDDIKILEILDSESNQEHPAAKQNRVDVKVRNAKGEIVIIEVQYEREFDYLHRILYGTAKVIVEHIKKGASYADVNKVISVNILYFDLGQGQDYIYLGRTRFIGMHQRDELQLSDKQKDFLHGPEQVYEIFPEYYLIKVNKFDDVAKDALDEWIYFLKNAEIKADFTAKGLQEASDTLNLMQLPDSERYAYDAYLEDLHYQASMFDSSYGVGKMDGRKEGREEGRKEGRKEGREEGRKEGRDESMESVAKSMKAKGFDPLIISEVTGLTLEVVKEL